MQNKIVKLALAIALLGLGGSSGVHAVDDYNLLTLQQQDQGLNPTPKKVGGLVAIAKDNPVGKKCLIPFSAICQRWVLLS